MRKRLACSDRPTPMRRDALNVYAVSYTFFGVSGLRPLEVTLPCSRYSRFAFSSTSGVMSGDIKHWKCGWPSSLWT
jgi:hypothetical protein